MSRTVYLQSSLATQGHLHPTTPEQATLCVLNVPADTSDMQVSQRMNEVGTWKVMKVDWAACVPGALLKT
jgi:hypothetical protein